MFEKMFICSVISIFESGTCKCERRWPYTEGSGNATGKLFRAFRIGLGVLDKLSTIALVNMNTAVYFL